MARFPGIKYDQPVQSLGRESPSGPITVAAAEANALSRWGDLAVRAGTIIDAQDTASKTAAFSNEMAELNAEVKNTKIYDRDQLREAGVEFDPLRTKVPAHEVATDYYKLRSEEIHNRYGDQMSFKGKKVLDKVYAAKYATGIDDVVGLSIRYANEFAAAKAEVDFEGAAKSGNEEGAMMVAKTAQMSGIWSPTYYASKVGPLAGRVMERDYLAQLDAADGVDDLEKIQDELLYSIGMSNSQVTALYTKFGAKINAQNVAAQKRITEFEKESSNIAMNVLTSAITEGVQLTAVQMLDATMGFLPADRSSAVAVWRADQNKVSTSDSDAYIDATLLVRGSILPGEHFQEGSTFLQRRADISAQLTDMLLNGDLVVDDFRTLQADLTALKMIPFKSPEYKMTEENIYITITGGSKGFMENTLGGGAKYKAGLAKALWDLNDAAIERGPNFDPRKWWKTNEKSYTNEAMTDAKKDWDESVESTNIKTDPNTGNINMTTSAKHLQMLVDAGMITLKEMNRNLTVAAEHQKRMDGFAKALESDD